MSRFGDATAVRRLGQERYQAELDGGFAFGEALNGGYLLAVMLRAAVDASPHQHPIATGAGFLRVARPGAAEVRVEPRKTGRTAAVSRVALLQDDQVIVDALVTTGTLDAAAEASWIAERPAEPPQPDDCLSTDVTDQTRGYADRVDMRFDPRTMGWLDGEPTGRPEMRAWFRLREEHDPDAYVLALAVDSLPPVALNIGANGWAPTVELTWHMRAVPQPGWLAVHGGGRLVSDGWFDEEVEVWDETGRLVAQSRQLARLGRPR